MEVLMWISHVFIEFLNGEVPELAMDEQNGGIFQQTMFD